MEDSKIVACRLCLRLISSDDSEEVDSITRDILQELIPDLNLDICDYPSLCRGCNKSMLAFYEFKNSCEKKLLHSVKVEGEENARSVKTERMEDELELCCFCQGSVDREGVAEFNQRKEVFNQAITQCLSDWDVYRSAKSIPCRVCLDSLQSLYAFQTACKNTEMKITKYCESHGTNSLGKINLFKALQFILSSDIKPETSADDMMDDESSFSIKTEYLDIKTEPEMDRCEDGTSSLAQRVGTSRDTKRLHSPTSQKTKASKQQKLEKPKPEMRSVGVQVNVRDLIEHCNVAVQVTALDFDVRSVASEAKPIVKDKEVMCKRGVRHAKTSTGGSGLKKKPSWLKNVSRKTKK